VEFGKEDIGSESSEAFGFFAFGNHGDAGEAAGGEACGIGIGSDRNVGFEAEIGGAASEIAGDVGGRPEERFESGEIKQSSVGRGVFDARRKRLRAVEQCGVRGSFSQGRTRAQGELGAGFNLNLRHARLNAELAGAVVDAENFLERRFAFEHSNRLRAQFRFGAQNGFDGKIGNEDAGVGHRTVVGRLSSDVGTSRLDGRGRPSLHWFEVERFVSGQPWARS
jgi:hypothetical protein